MFILQPECGPRMIEIVNAFNGVKGIFIVALPAVLPEFILMRVCMASDATIEQHSCKYLEG
jgi:hypothetical protein